MAGTCANLFKWLIHSHFLINAGNTGIMVEQFLECIFCLFTKTYKGLHKHKHNATHTLHTLSKRTMCSESMFYKYYQNNSYTAVAIMKHTKTLWLDFRLLSVTQLASSRSASIFELYLMLAKSR